MNKLRKYWKDAEISENMLDLLNKLLSFEQRVQDTQDAADAPAFEEYEIKLRCTDSIFAQINALGGLYKGAAIERNLIYDDRQKSLHEVDARLRIRTFEDIYSTNSTALVTVKKPRPSNGSVGAREFEAELLLKGEEATKVSSLFLGNGLQVISSYERVRHYVGIKGLQAKFDIDLFPDIGRFVEIEGLEKDVLQAAKLLNVNLDDTDPTPYDTIHADWCLAQGKAEEDHIRFPVPYAELIKREKTFGEIWGYKAL